MPRRARKPDSQLSLLEPRLKTAPCVPAIRKAVDAWRADKYKGVTATTRALLNHWFKTDHRLPNGRAFTYHDSQKFAIETLIYLYEVARVRRHKDLVEQYAGSNKDLRLLQYDEFARYCIKMATGSGKTKIMSLAIVWQYFNAVLENADDYATTFLVIAPNVIVFERLKADFASGRIFKVDPLIPPELKIHWDFDCYMRGDGERAHSLGALYLTNIQQFYERDNGDGDEPDIMTAVLGAKPPAQPMEIADFDTRIIKRGGRLLVVNDEAHHTHDEESEWNKSIRQLHASLTPIPLPLPPSEKARTGEGEQTPSPVRAVGERGRVGVGVAAQLDFSATPRYSMGSLFTWTIYDYPLKQAIIDGIVKRPTKGITTGIRETPSSVTSTKYKAYLTAGVERWREYREQLAQLKRKPLLFVMMNTTDEAEDVGDYLRTKYPSEFGGDQLLVIHTDRKGEVSKRDLDKARTVAREVDDLHSPINAIVSVLMLREGWDVQNVTVVVGLRPYSSKANILPEQTIGRGLRLMFRGFATAYTERVDVIGNKAFIEFVEQLEKDEDIKLDTFEVGKDKLTIVTIAPDPDKLDKDIALPVLSPILTRKRTLADEIVALDVSAIRAPKLPRKSEQADIQQFHYEGYDFITLQKIVERDYKLPDVQTSQEVISYYAKRIAQDVKLPSQFAALVPKVREFLEVYAFGERVNLDDPALIKAISSEVVQFVTVREFVRVLRPLVVQELQPQLLDAGRKLSVTPPFPYSRPTFDSRKCVFNLVPCGNEFEKSFAKFLHNAPDVAAFAKLPEQFGFAIEYTDANNNLRYYEPDFVAVAEQGTNYLIETKGREDVDVANKDRAATLWAENATRLTGTEWKYIKVKQAEYEALQATEFADVVVIAQPALL